MTRHKALWAGLAVVLVVLQLALQCRAAKIARENPALGVQLAAPLTAETLTAARAWEQSDANTAGITASYWKQETDTVSTDFGRTAEGVACIGFDGTAGDCLPADYRQGTAPGAVGQQCALSTALAWALFGSADIVGQTVTMGRVDYTLCGVFDADTNILLYPAQAGFTNAALRGVSSDTPRAAAEQWAASAGVGAVKSITYGPQKVWLARMLCCLPALAVGLCLLVLLLRTAARLPGPARGGVYFALALAFALVLPRFLQTLPGWILPGRWSDFGFWVKLAQEIKRAL